MIHLLTFFIWLSACASTQVYNRKEWHPRWLDEDKNCRNTRAEILIKRSLQPVTFTNNKKCSVKNGKWEDYYFPSFHYQAKEVDIDHLVPLYEAHKSGGANWSLEMKRKFANDPDNLVLTSKQTNRSKGANTLKTWLPVNLAYACKYYKQWMLIKKKYQLLISQDEIDAIDTSKCK